MGEDKGLEKPKTMNDIVRQIAARLVKNENFLLVVILLGLVSGFAGMTRGLSVTVKNASNILLQSATRGVATMGQAFVILTAGIDLSVGGLATLSLMVGAAAMGGRPEVVAVPGGPGFPVGAIALILLVGLGMGLVNGMLVSRVRVPPLIVTLCVWQICQGLAWKRTSGMTLYHIPTGLNVIGQGRVGPVPVPAIIFMAAAIVVYFVLNHTSLGRCVYAVGGNPVSAWLSGIRVQNIILTVYAISGFCAALAGLILLSRLMVGSMLAASGLELDSIAAACVGGISLMGGRGSLLGAVLGVFIIGVINNGMNLMVIPAALQQVVRGIVIIVAVAIDYSRKR